MFRVISFIFIFVLNTTLSLEDIEFHRNAAEFAVNLYQESVKGNNGSVVMSPYSIHIAFGLLYMGADGDTAQQLFTGLRLTSSDKLAVGTIFEKIIKNNETYYTIANKIYVDVEYKLNSEFQDIATNMFNSNSENIDFGDTEYASDTINEWIGNKTNNKIQDVVTSDSFQDKPAMVLINAIYFNAPWKYKFSEKFTKPRPFWIHASESVDIATMKLNAVQCLYKEINEINAKAIQLPYANDSNLAMLILLPNERDGLSDMEDNLNKTNLFDILHSMSSVKLSTVEMPKFKINYEVALNDILTNMNISLIFTNGADLSGVLDSVKMLKVSSAIHKAMIEVSEEGTEAAAVTVAQLVPFSISGTPETFEFIADHPFFYAIVSQTGILFTGRFLGPA